jgi:hypothetical protein
MKRKLFRRDPAPISFERARAGGPLFGIHHGANKIFGESNVNAVGREVVRLGVDIATSSRPYAVKAGSRTLNQAISSGERKATTRLKSKPNSSNRNKYRS